MKIAIDLSQFDRDGAGVNYVMKGLLEGLPHFSEHQYFAAARTPLGDKLPKGWEEIMIPPYTKWQGGGLRWYSTLAKELGSREVDALISVTLNAGSFFFPHTYQIVHDMIPYTHPQYFPSGFSLRHRLLFNLNVRYAQKLVAVSNTTAEQIKQIFPRYRKDIPVIPEGLHAWAHAPRSQKEIDRVKEKYDIRGKYFYSIGTVQPRKNYPNTVRAFQQFTHEHPEYDYLITGGKGWLNDELNLLLKEESLMRKVKLIGYTPEEDLAPLLDGASGFLITSFAEGFGLPVLEATARNVPILASDLGVFREIVDESRALFVDPNNVAEMKMGMEKLVKMDKLAASKKIVEKYTWERCAEKLLQAISLKI